MTPFGSIQFEADYDVEKMRRLVDDLDRQFASIAIEFTEIANDPILKPILVTTTTHVAGVNNVILVDDDAAGATVTVFLPAVADALATEAFYHVKKLGTTANVVIDGDGAETIDDLLTQTIVFQFDSFMLVPEASRWHII